MRSDLLEFASVKGYIKKYIVCDMGMTALENLAPLDTWAEARSRWELLREMMHLIKTQRPHFAPLADIRPLLTLCEGSMLEGQDLLKVAGALKDMAMLRGDLEVDGFALADMARGITPLDGLAREIDVNILPTGEVSDLTNPALQQLRIRFRQLRISLLDKLEHILERVKPAVMEDIITIRNNRFVIPMRHDYGVYMQGIIHDYSGSRHSAYVEPLEVVEDNNALNELKSDIREEEQKVLMHLTSLIVHAAQTIQANLDIYAMLDLLHAGTQWALETGSSIPELGDTIQLKGARHPVLLERLGRGCVPLDIALPNGKNCLIISGPNAGGKTVALKTIGLMIMMAKSGLAIPAQTGSRIPPIGRVWVEMDTAQDIAHDLSTFTAHATALKEIYAQVCQGDLVLLDEPGTGTDHDHGGAIAIACIDAYCNKGAYVVATSHSELVKLYGLSQKGVENAAVAFDDNGLKPLYTLQYGVIGSSRAFDILRSIAFPGELVDAAQDIVARKGNTALLKAMEDMTHAYELKASAQKERDEVSLLKAKAEVTLGAVERQKIESALKYKRLFSKLEALVQRPKRDAIKAMEELPEVIELREVLQTIEPLAEKTLRISKGSPVRFKDADVEGVVVEVSGGMAEVQSGGKRISVSLDQIEAVEKTGQKARKGLRHVRAFAPVVLPIVVVGMRVDEAMPIVERALDRAMLAGQEHLEIIHGSGTGTLKKAIRGHLKGLAFVKGFSDGPEEQGGGNMTIVRL
jgi:DNA mismatch repair protein MutS2